MDTEEDFIRAIVSGNDCRLAFAEWLESQGRFTAALAQRWVATDPDCWWPRSDNRGHALILERALLGISGHPDFLFVNGEFVCRTGPDGPISLSRSPAGPG